MWQALEAIGISLERGHTVFPNPFVIDSNLQVASMGVLVAIPITALSDCSHRDKHTQISFVILTFIATHFRLQEITSVRKVYRIQHFTHRRDFF